MSRATDDLLDQLHALQASSLLSAIKRAANSEDGIPPALFAQVNKFLKDNGVDRPHVPGDTLDQLADEVPDFTNVVNGDFNV